ncbi:hypothetical protein [Novipirellula caenicola]|uniref:Restriction endonuclease type IV Mrr domain-containing protein n=1 Tax=Novipirellula caenicola TaxID=1536901 RepID=A0ABP9W1G4_9BACT
MEERIREWLETQGYPLEMKVASLFRSMGFRIVQSEYYKDAETGSQRETDVTARVDCEFHGLLVRIEFIIECKSTPDKPWVLFTGGRGLADPARVAQRAASKLGSKALMELCKRKDIQDLALFQMHERSAYGVTQAFTTGNDTTFASATSVSKATAAEIAETNEYSAAVSPVCLIAIPLIVINAELAEAYLNENSELIVTRTNSGTLAWRHKLVGEPHTIIRVLRVEEVESYADDMFASCMQFFDLASDTFKRMANERQNNCVNRSGTPGGN